MRVYLFCLALACLPGVLLAQSGGLRGTIADAETGNTLPGANLTIVELAVGSAADIDGDYFIDALAAGSYTVRVSFVGYRTHEQQITVTNQVDVVNFRLTPDFGRLDEIVVTGLSSERSRATADVAVGRVDADKLIQNNQFRNFSQMITGRVSGVTVQPASGNVGSGIRYVMRTITGINGDGQPLVFVDGVRVEDGNLEAWSAGGQEVSMLAQLNPQDIERIDVLKGPASAALYGTSGSNGVVLVKTRSGALGAPLTFSYRGMVGVNSLAREYDIFNASNPEATNDQFRDGQIGDHQFNLQGGARTIRYYASYARRKEDGHIQNSSQNRNSFRGSFEVFPSPRLSVRANASYLVNDVFRPLNDGDPSGVLAQTLLFRNPYWSVDSIAYDHISNLQDIARFTGSFDAEYRPLAGLALRATVGLDATEIRGETSADAGFRTFSGDQGYKGILSDTFRRNTVTLNARYNYRLTGSFSAQTMVGLQAFEFEWNEVALRKEGFSTDLITTLDAANDFTVGTERFENSRESGVFVTQELTFEDRLYLTLGLRRDYASAIGFESPSILYPRASFALRLDRIWNLPFGLNFLKLRSAYGEAGQLPGPLDGLPLLWTAESSGYGAGAVLSRIGNSEIQPERISEFEIGLEFGLFGDRINFDGSYYEQRAKNSIVGFVNPQSSGQTASPIPRNIGRAKGRGIETMLTATPIHQANYGLDLGLIWDWQTNEVTDLGGANPIFDGVLANVIKEGLPNGAYYTLQTRATFNENGTYAGPEFTTEDEDGDGEPDRLSFGTPYPEHTGSFLLNFRFLRNFHFSGLLAWQLGLRLFYRDRAFRAFATVGTDARRNVALVQIGEVEDPCEVHLCGEDGNLWPRLDGFDVSAQPVGSDEYRAAAEVVASSEGFLQGHLLIGNFVEDADFVRLRELSLRYDFSDLIRRSSLGGVIRRLDLTIAARNLFTSSSFSGIDPEASMGGAVNLHRSSFFTLPQPRTIYTMISLSF